MFPTLPQSDSVRSRAALLLSLILFQVSTLPIGSISGSGSVSTTIGASGISYSQSSGGVTMLAPIPSD